MLRLLDGFDAYATGNLPPSNLWTVASGVVIVPDAGRSGFAGDNAAFFDTALGSVLKTPATAVAVGGIYTGTWGHAVRILSVADILTLGGIDTAISRFDLQVTAQGALRVTQTTGGVLLGTICQTEDGVVPIGSGGCAVALRLVQQAGLASAIRVYLSDQYGAMNPVAQGAILAFTAADAPYTTIRHGGGVGDGAAQWYVDDVYQTDGVRAATPLIVNGQVVWNDGVLGNLHAQTFYATADGADQTDPWTASSGAVYACINEHPPDEDTRYIETNVIGATSTCLFASPESSPFGRQNCSAYASLFGLLWLGRLRTTSVAGSVAPVVTTVGTGSATGTAIPVSDASYLYYPQVFDRNPTLANVPWTFGIFVPAGAGVAGTTEFGLVLES